MYIPIIKDVYTHYLAHFTHHLAYHIISHNLVYISPLLCNSISLINLPQFVLIYFIQIVNKTHFIKTFHFIKTT